MNARAVLLAAAAGLAAGSALAHTLHVPAEYPTIQHALVVAGAGDTVRVAPGTYYESITWPATPALRLMSQTGFEATTITGMGSYSVIRIATPVDTTTLIEGFTITGGYAANGGGIHCAGSAPTIRRNRITGNTATDYGGGICCEGAGRSAVIRENEIIGNHVLDGSGGGVCAYGDVSPVITGNLFRDNTADLYFGGAIHCETFSGAGGRIVIEGNTFTGNSAYGGGALSFMNPYIDPPRVHDDEIAGNQAQLGGGIYSNWSLAAVSGCRVQGNSASNAGGGIFAEESHDLAVDDCEIGENTAAGRGGGLALVNWCSAPQVTRCVIRGNTAAGGGAVYCYFYSSPTFRGCQFRENRALDRGGAFFCENLCAPAIDECAVLDNRAPIAGGLYAQQAQPTVTGCVFSGNDAAALHFTNGWTGHTPQIHGSSIDGNPGYGVFNEAAAVPVAAQSNWWGDPSGPYHPTQNPGGLGDRVSDSVVFVPWLLDPGGVSGVPDAPIAAAPRLSCSPNPFHASTTILLETPDGPVPGARVGIYDVSGRLVRRLPLGVTGRAIWDGRDERGVPLPGGVHYLRLEAGGGGRGARAIRLP
jgi:predicted outer membrane repeat protein